MRLDNNIMYISIFCCLNISIKYLNIVQLHSNLIITLLHTIITIIDSLGVKNENDKHVKIPII